MKKKRKKIKAKGFLVYNILILNDYSKKTIYVQMRNFCFYPTARGEIHTYICGIKCYV